MDAPRPIRPLAEHVINQIAAGEVIERPASVVKELIENSVDAGASRIEVEIEGGGIERIVVSDNGSGIRGEEIAAALTRHCTSKLSDAAELGSIASLGFRGEALASIAAVAEMRIVTRTTGSEHAWEVFSVPGEALAAPRPARGNCGTRIEIARLFHQVPARKRFLKQARTEGLHVQRVVRQLAFARPDLGIGFQHGQGRGLRLPAGSFDELSPRWQTLFGTISPTAPSSWDRRSAWSANAR